jgi:ADP-ribose pyrophosphatase YjhB (NUDIX family)
MIHAAGGVPWRPSPDGIEVALVHRPRYDDWSLPKGKLAPGEHPLTAAYREVVEETGVIPVLGSRLPIRHYDTPKGAKTVHYWSMRVRGDGAGDTSEVDRPDWRPLPQARDRPTYPGDQPLLDAVEAATRIDGVVLLVRHASAGDPDRWTGDDQERPLDRRGRSQAEPFGTSLRCSTPSGC